MECRPGSPSNTYAGEGAIGVEKDVKINPAKLDVEVLQRIRLPPSEGSGAFARAGR
jgi:hypothetical protein